MNRDRDGSNLFTPGASLDSAPAGDVERQAIHALRGYAYQIAVSALAWLDLDEKSFLYLEVAEDYATVAGNALNAVQVRDTAASGSVTLNTGGVRDAIHAFVDLIDRNPRRAVELRYLTTSPIGAERSRADRPAGEAGLTYWRKAATGADPGPLRSLLQSDGFSEAVRGFVRARDDDELRRDLLRMIHWDCGQPDIAGVRRELEESLIVLGRDRFRLSSEEARRLVDILMHNVLKKSTLTKAAERVLTRAELYSVIDAATGRFVPNAAADTITQLASAFASGLVGTPAGVVLAAGNIGWLIAGDDLPARRFIIPRPELEASITKAVESYGLAVLVGAAGLGKSLTAGAVAGKLCGGFVIADLHKTEGTEARRRLDLLLGRIGAMRSRGLVLEDFDHFEDAGISMSFGCVAEALRRRDRIGLVTSHRRPSARTLAELGIDAAAVIEIPYFSEGEAAEVVRTIGGDAEKWGRLAFVAGAHGHPQLVHAFALGMAARGWPEEAMLDVVVRGLTSEDTDAERDAARRSLAAALPADARMLLYRLSLTIVHFDRALALDIGSLSPPVSRAGEQLDELIGPWIEAIGSGRYRVSPLVSNAGRETLGADEQRNVHNQIATQLLARQTIDAWDTNAILTHAMLGKSTQCLAVLANSVITADKNTRSLLAEHFFMLRILRTDGLIYPDHPAVSRMLRLAQFRLVAETEKGPDILACVTALLNEAGQESNAELRTAFECVALVTVLITVGIADHVPNWIDLLVRLIAIVEATPDLRELKANFEKASGAEGVSFYGSLFSIGASGISSVKRLEEVIDALDGIDATKRSVLLREYKRKPSDYGLLVDGPWLAEHMQEAIDPADAAERYGRMAERTRRWGIRGLALRCHAARSVMLNEYGNDKEAGLRALDEGIAALGEDIVLSHARAKILWQDNDHAGAVTILHDIADRIGRDNPIERAFAMREAAISAAKTNDWRQAEIWFADGRTAAAAAQTVDMHAMAVGLGADAAVAALKTGDISRALGRLAESLIALRDLDAEASLRTAYCHRVVRYTVLWAKSQIEGDGTKIDGKPIGMLPGTCSNPEPLAAIRESPLAPLDVAWYKLTEAEIAAGADVGIAETLYSKLAGGPIPITEAALRKQRIATAIARLDPLSFAKHLWGWLEGIAFLQEERHAPLDVLSPGRGEIPPVVRGALANDDLIQATAVDANLAFCIVAVFEGRADAITVLECRLTDEFGNEFPGAALFKHWRGDAAVLSPLDKVCANGVGLLRKGEHFEPPRLWEIGLRLFEKGRQSWFKLEVTPVLAKWMRAQWRRVLAEERFRLSQPTVTVPGIEAILAKQDNDVSFVAALLLATSPAVRASLAATYRDLLKGMLRGASTADRETVR
jgi:hypothetical protein